ncbi:MAG: UDP-N-acetylmuramate dehydrogenase [Nitrospirae bacterium]|nr:UDP-N-acetylmuramate dehydrogenase [Nitrospirota bacterium]
MMTAEAKRPTKALRRGSLRRGSGRACYRELLEGVRGEVRFDEPMARHTSFRVGGPADVMVFPKDGDDLARALDRFRREEIPLFVLGGGCNLLIRDGGIRGGVISLRDLSRVEGLPAAPGALGEPVSLAVEAGMDLARLLALTVREGLSGLEFTAGIPGTLGGALVMNAGSFGGEMSGVVRSLTVMDHRGEVQELRGEEARFGYRVSHIPGRVILGGVLETRRGETAKIREIVHGNLLRKKTTQPVRFPSAGSVFKNLPGKRAWEAIHSVGLRGVRIGGAQVSEMHANYIVNRGGATARDVMELIHRIGKRVERELGLTLELEIRIVGEG